MADEFALDLFRSIQCGSGNWYQVLQRLDSGRNAAVYLVMQPCILDSLEPIPGSHGSQMLRVNGEMLRMRSAERLTAAKLIDRWRTPFRNVASLLHALEGRVF